MLQRNFVYTGVSRGKRRVLLVGHRKALAIARQGDAEAARCAKLRKWLVGYDRISSALDDAATNLGLSAMPGPMT